MSFLANIVSRDVQSVTSRNINLVKHASRLSPWDYSSARIKSALEKTLVPNGAMICGAAEFLHFR